MISAWTIKHRPDDKLSIKVVRLHTRGSVVCDFGIGYKSRDPSELVGYILSRSGDMLCHVIFRCTDGNIRIAPIPKYAHDQLVNNLEIITDNEFDALNDVYEMLSL